MCGIEAMQDRASAQRVQRGGAEDAELRGGKAEFGGGRRWLRRTVLCLALSGLVSATTVPAQEPTRAADALLLTGTVQALHAQRLRAPRMDAWRMQIQWMAEEGSLVQAGDPVVRIDSANLASEIEQLELQMLGAAQRAQKELAELEVALLDADLALVQAEAKLAKARIDAGVPATHLPAIQFERHRLDAERAGKERDEAAGRRATAAAAIEKRREELALERRALEIDLGRKRAQLDASTLRAERAGAVLYATDPQTGSKLGVGGNVQFSTLLAQVTTAEDLLVVAWLNEVDALRLPAGATARLTLDAHPERPFAGRVLRQGGAAERREAWGEGRWFELEIDIEPPAGLSLTPGMSVLVEIELAAEAA